MKKLLAVITVAGLLVFTGYAFYKKGYKTASSPSVTPQPTVAEIVGADRDVHGCIGSAGYVWCEPKNKCLRDWEEKCFTDTAGEIQYLLAKKYNKQCSKDFIELYDRKIYQQLEEKIISISQKRLTKHDLVI